VGTNSTTYTDVSTPVNGDNILCVITSNVSCPSPPDGQVFASGITKVLTAPNCYCASTISGTANSGAFRGITQVKIVGNSITLDQHSNVTTVSPYYAFYYTAPVARFITRVTRIQ